MTDVAKSKELDRLERLYKKTVEQMQLARRDWERTRLEFELQLRNIAFSMDQARGWAAPKAGA